jgi:hypothetical protein
MEAPIAYMTPWVAMSWLTDFAKDAPMREAIIITKPTKILGLRYRGFIFKAMNQKGADTYIRPVAVVPMAAMLEPLFAKCCS